MSRPRAGGAALYALARQAAEGAAPPNVVRVPDAPTIGAVDPISEIMFTVLSKQPLALALRAALGESGMHATLREVMSWIAAGRVRVDDQVERDPARGLTAGACIELAAWAAPEDRDDAPPADEIASLHHVDDEMLVAEYTPPLRVPHGGSVALMEHLRNLLAKASIDDRVPILCPDHEPRASGLVAAGMAPAGIDQLDGRHRPLGVRVNVKAIVRASPDADLEGLTVSTPRPGVLLVRTPPTEGSVKVLADLEARGLVVLEAHGPGPPGTRPLLMHVAGIALTHPLTGRTSMFACRQGEAFSAALDDETP